MRLVVADTGPINYLILIEAIEVLPKLFEMVFAPRAVHDELAHVDAPPAVRAWIAHCPAWLQVRPNPDWNTNDAAAAALDEASVPQSRLLLPSAPNSFSLMTAPGSPSHITEV